MKQLNTVLLIDDNEDDNFFHKIVLKNAGVKNIMIAESGKDGLELLAKNGEPDVIFLDINMPAMNGWEFLEHYKKLYKKESVIVIMLSTSLNPADAERAKKVEEINEYRTKPLTLEMIEQIKNRYFM